MKKQWKESNQKCNNNDNSGNGSQNSVRKDKLQLTQKEKTCHCCGKTGHTAPDCPDREKMPRNERCVHKAVSAHQNNETKEDDKP